MMKFIFKYPQLILFFMALSACQNPSSGVDAAFSPTTTANTSTGGTVANTPPILIAAPSSASYIATVVGTPQTVSLSITNVGQDIAVVSGEALTSSVGSAADFSIVSDLCNGTTLLSGGSCTVGLTYAPVSSSTDEGSFVISYQTPSGTTKTLSIPYSGTASLPQAQVASNPSSYSYGSIPQGSIVSKTFVISNNSLGAVTFNAASISLGTGYTVTSDACSGITLSSASSPSTCAITLTFSPAAIGLTPGTLSLVYRNLSNTTLQTDIALQGSLSVSARPVLVGAPGSNSFGNEIVSTTSASSFTLTNSGSATASIQNLQLTGSSAFAITSDLCSSTTLAVGSSCVVGIRYSPSATGSNTGQISVPYQAPDATSYTYTQSLSGAGVIAPPAVTVAPGSWDYGLVAQGASGTKVFTITNPSIGNATFTGASISANTTNYTITSNTCTGLTLNSSSSPLSCAVSVRFAPTAIATSFSSLILNYTNASATSLTSSVSLTGGMTGTLRPVLSFSPSIASFSGVTAGMSASTTLTMANSGSAAATLGTISVAGTNAALFSISSDTCSSASLSVGASCTVQLTYAPVSAGTHSGSLQLSYTAPDSSSYSVSESLSGTAEVASSTIAASPASNDYGLIAQGANASQTFTITNPSTGGITFAASGTATLSNSTQYTITANTCVSKTVSSSAPTSCAVTVRFAPTAVATSFSVLSLNYTNSSGVASASNISLTGGMAGTLRPVLSLSPALTSFASTFVNATSTATLTLTNSGTATATLGAFSFSGTNSAFFTTSSDNCSSQSLTVGSSCTAVLTYAPVATGSHTGTLQMTYAAPDSSSFTVSQALTGTGVVVPSTIAVSPASNDFGLIAQGSNASQTFTITNSSVGGITFAAAGTATLSNSTQYTITSNTCVSKTVSSSAPTSCTVTVRFAPTALATSFSTLTLNYTNSAGATAASSISLTGGMAGTLRPIIYSGMGTYNFGNVQTTTSQIQTITYTNLGTAAAAIGATPWTTTGSTTFSLSNNTCAGQTIAVGGLCSVDVTFTPATTAVYTGTFTIPYTSPDGTALSTTQGLSGTGTPNSAVRPILIAAASSLTYATTSTSSSSSLSITIINSGTDLASISTASLTASTGTTTPFTFTTDTCSSHVLISGASCSVVMQFAPSSAGSYSGYVNFPYTGTSSSPSYTITVPYSATATLPQPVVVSAPLSWDFGTVNPGSSVTKTFTISNSSSGQATFQAATITGGGFSIQAASDNCSGKVITSTSTPSTCTIVVVYTPTNVGSMIGTLTLNYTNASSTAMTTTVSLTGTAAITLRPIVITSPSTLAYGNVNIGATSSQTFTITNAGTATATMNTDVASGARYSITADTCAGNSVAVGASCNVTVLYTPTTAGSDTGYVTVSYKDSVNTPYTYVESLSGTAILPQPSITSAPSTYAFPLTAAGSTASNSFIISNNSSGAATFQSSTITGTGFSVTSDGCYTTPTATTLSSTSSPATCTITVQFAPTIPGSVLGALTLNYTNAQGAAQTTSISISGVGNAPQPTLTLSPSPYNFGNVATNTYGSQVIQVSNNTTVSATIGTPTVSGTGYSISASTCTSVVLGAAQNCTITVKFTPTATGAVSGTLTVPYTSSQSISYTATDTLGGTGITPITSFSFGGATGYTNLTATGATVQWTAQTLATYYIVRATAGATVITSAHIAPTSLASYNITGLTPGTTYQLKVNAYDSIDESDGNTNSVSITTPNVTAATFNGWSDVVALGPVYTDIGTVDTAYGNTGANRWDENLGAVAGFINTAVNTTTNQITSNTVFATGVQVTFNTDGTAPGGLTNASNYWVIKVNSTTMQLASTAANAAAGTAIVFSSAGTGNMTLMPTAVVKLGWELFTFTPSGSASSYNIYRDTSASFTTSTLVGTSTTQSFSDWTPATQTTYYYQIKPVVTGVEVNPTVVNDSYIQVYVPPTNMSLLHRWIVNREACTTLLGFTFSTGVSRSTNYSCAYAWGGTGASAYGASSGYDQTKWDLGYSLIVDRWQNGCKISAVAAAYGSAAPSGGSNNQVYLKTGAGTTAGSTIASCYIKDVTLGWSAETAAISNTSRSLIRTNYPGYNSTGLTQSQAYNTCQTRNYAGVVDGNGNTKLRLMRLHEFVIARAPQGVNVNNRNAGVLATIFNGSALPTNGSCNTPGSNNASGGYLYGVTIPNPSTSSLTNSGLMNGTYLSANCYSRYEVSNLVDNIYEWASTQYYGPSASGGYFIQSALDAGDSLLAGYLMNGTVGPTQVFSNTTNNTFFGTTSSSNIFLPLFGVRAVSVDAILGSKTITMSNIDYGTIPNVQTTYISAGGAATNGVITGQLAGPNSGYYDNGTSRYNFGLNNITYSGSPTLGNNPVSLRCSGQVGP